MCIAVNRKKFGNCIKRNVWQEEWVRIYVAVRSFINHHKLIKKKYNI